MLKRDKAGFTLIELMIVIVVLGIVTAIALPSFLSIIEKRRLVGAADTLFANLQFAHSEAIKQNRIVQFQFNTDNWCYGVDDDTPVDCDCTSPATCTVSNMQRVITSSEYKNVTLAVTGFGGTTIDFEPRQGMPSDDGEFTFTINGQSKKVNINVVGKIKVD
ncbi:MAG: GspH/FimT family pseudopilin [Gammaproteobacteria bacterium]|nr:GspH/FimT family pseudopilin [Gammaproteobacteria bacterium]